jgi:hypothetical protein
MGTAIHKRAANIASEPGVSIAGVRLPEFGRWGRFHGTGDCVAATSRSAWLCQSRSRVLPRVSRSPALRLGLRPQSPSPGDGRRSAEVAQVCNLPYRRIAFGRAWTARGARMRSPGADCKSAIQQNEILRYGGGRDCVAAASRSAWLCQHVSSQLPRVFRDNPQRLGLRPQLPSPDVEPLCRLLGRGASLMSCADGHGA